MTKEEWQKKANELVGFFWLGGSKYPISQFEEVCLAWFGHEPLPTPKENTND